MPDTDRSPFTLWLDDHRDGALTDEITAALADVTAAVAQFGKPGSVTITLKIEPKGRAVAVADDVKVKAPAADRIGDIYFPDADGNLHRDDPAQQRLPLSELDGLGGLRVVNFDTGEITSNTIPTSSTGEQQ
jgi:hypothetical protein